MIASGQTFVTIRVDGLTLEDFLYTPPGPGGATGVDAGLYTGIGISVKIPGLTTWMDLGRSDGDGPSKLDPLQDGAGCKVIGPETFNGIDPDSGMVYAQVKVNVGPAITLADGQSLVPAPGITVYETPVLVKVTMSLLAADYDLTQVATSAGQFDGVTRPGALPSLVRGLCGIRIVHPDDL